MSILCRERELAEDTLPVAMNWHLAATNWLKKKEKENGRRNQEMKSIFLMVVGTKLERGNAYLHLSAWNNFFLKLNDIIGSKASTSTPVTPSRIKSSDPARWRIGQGPKFGSFLHIPCWGNGEMIQVLERVLFPIFDLWLHVSIWEANLAWPEIIFTADN